MSSQKKEKPVACVCIENNSVGIVLRSDYETASREYWQKVEMPSRPERWIGAKISPHNVFVFNKYSPAHFLLAMHCKVEQAEYRIPRPSSSKSDEEFMRATHHLLGEKLELNSLLDELYFQRIGPGQSVPMDLRIIGHDSWQQAFPATTEYVRTGDPQPKTCSTADFIVETWADCTKSMLSAPTMENLIVTHFVMNLGFNFEELMIEDDSNPGILLTWIKDHPSYLEPPIKGFEDWSPRTIAFMRAKFTSSSGNELVEQALQSANGPFLNKRYIFHKVVLTPPPTK